MRRLATLAVVGVIVLAGTLPGNRNDLNQMTWALPGPGLRLDGASQCIGETPIWADRGELTIELWLTPTRPLGPRNREIVSLVDTPGVHRLLVGEFQGGLIFRGRADNPTGDPKQDLYRRLKPGQEVRHLAVTVDSSGAALHVNGAASGLALPATRNAPGARLGGRLLLGSSDSGWEPWQGVIHALAVHQRILGGDELERHAILGGAGSDRRPADGWTLGPGEQRELSSGPDVVALYLFDEADGGRAESSITGAPALLIPARLLTPLAQDVIWTPTGLWNQRYWLPRDLLLNVAAFIPLGLLLAWRGDRRAILVAVGIGAGLSLSIEVAQLWIPGRNPSLVDWVCNGAGALMGALGACAAERIKRSRTKLPA